MLRLLADENFNGHLIRALRSRCPTIVLVRVQDVGLLEADDPTVLQWAASNDYILLTHDRATIPDFAYQTNAAIMKSGIKSWPTCLFNRQREFRDTQSIK